MSELSGETFLEAAESADFQIDSSLKGFCLGEISVRAGVPPPTPPAAHPVSERLNYSPPA